MLDSVLSPNDTMAFNGSSSSNSSSSNMPAIAYPGAKSGSVDKFTSGLPIASNTYFLLTATTDAVASGYATHTGAIGANNADTASSDKKTKKSKGGAAAMPTGAIGAAALFGGVGLLANF